MTRPKVDPDKRQRTAQACDSCKRRKQKCNGVRPCNTCTRRRLDCQYTPNSLNRSSSQDSVRSSAKRRHVSSSPQLMSPQDGLGSPAKRRYVEKSPNLVKSSMEIGRSTTRKNSSLAQWNQSTGSGGMGLGRTAVIESVPRKQMGESRALMGGEEEDSDTPGRLSINSGAADEAEVYPSNRMLQDSTGRLLYIGDSASLSYLQWIRMIVESVSGPSDFTLDPRRHMIMENRISLPQDLRPTGVLPDRGTATILIKSFFTNTAGFIEVFNRQAFLQSVDECYKDPLSIPPSLLCLLYLVFAIGLVMAAPFPGSPEAVVIEKLRAERANRAELFFRNAKSLADPVSGFEDADFWSIQALLLMSLYMLAVSKRNACYAYYGMAVRSAFALGLHRDESEEIFTLEERVVRRNLWRTLFVFDRFISACLGRPTAISEEDCSTSVFKSSRTTTTSSSISTEATHLAGLEAAVKTSRVLGMTLKRVYSKRKISTVVGQEIAHHCDIWNRELPHFLHWSHLVNGTVDSTQGIAILQINLLHCHSVMLLTRPYFLCLLNKALLGSQGTSSKAPRISYRMDSLAQTCVLSSQHTLVLTQAVLDRKYLPQCNPFVIHFVFAAALIALSNEFASLYHNPDARASINSAISILRFCAQNDKQAERVSYIVESFDKANEQRPAANRLFLPGRETPVLPTLSPNSSFDPMNHFFLSGRRKTIPTTPSAFSDKTIPVAPAAPSAPSAPAAPAATTGLPPLSSIQSTIPLSMQQPSPEESVSMSSGITGTTAGMAQGVDAASGGDSEFDLESMWHSWQNISTLPAAVHPGTFASYSYGQPQLHSVAATGPTVMYHPSDFKM